MLVPDQLISSSNQIDQLLSGTASNPDIPTHVFSFQQRCSVKRAPNPRSTPYAHLVFVCHGSRTNEMWCPDCEEMETNLRNVLTHITMDKTRPKDDQDRRHEGDKGSLVIVYVGDRNQWTAAENPFRQPPWNLTRIPTVLKLEAPSNGDTRNLQDAKQDLLQNIRFEEQKLVEGEALDFKKLLDFLS